MLCLFHTPLTLLLVAYFLSKSSLNSLSFHISLTLCQPTHVRPTQSCSITSISPFPPYAHHRSWPLTIFLPLYNVSHESRYPNMCGFADPVSTSRIGCPSRFNRCSLARRGVDYICMVKRRASQLTHSINGAGKKKWRLRVRREWNFCQGSTPLVKWLYLYFLLTFSF